MAAITTSVHHVTNSNKENSYQCLCTLHCIIHGVCKKNFQKLELVKEKFYINEARPKMDVSEDRAVLQRLT